MSSGLDHPLVRAYLSGLETALAALPPEQAAELREQITAHLDDALTPDADEQFVSEVLHGLGQPADLAAEAGAPLQDQSVAPDEALHSDERRRRRRVLAGVAGAVVLVAAWIGYVVVMHSVGGLQARGGSTWWYPVDGSHQVISRADGLVQTTVRIRSGQRQGYVIEVYNPSDLTQTVLGGDYVNGPESPASQFAQFAVSTQQINGGVVPLRSARYEPQGVIPPHQSRAVRVLWTSTACDGAGDGTILDQVQLKVRIGWITRKEVIQLNESISIVGPSTGKYSVNSTLCGG